MDNPAAPAIVSVAYDTTTGRITSETFTYDPLNRLASYTVLGGARSQRSVG
jgi:hypothetical protein